MKNPKWHTYRLRENSAAANFLAKRMDRPFRVKTNEGGEKGKAGDFLAVGADPTVDRAMWPIDKEIFFKTMKLVTPGIQNAK